jgi:hypothetical protein
MTHEPGLGTIMIELGRWFKKRVYRILWGMEDLKNKMNKEAEEPAPEPPKPPKPKLPKPIPHRSSIFGIQPAKPNDNDLILWDDAIQIMVNSMKPVANAFTNAEMHEEIIDSQKIRMPFDRLLPRLVDQYGIKFQEGIKPFKILKYSTKYSIIIQFDFAKPCYYQIDAPLGDHVTNRLIKNGCPVITIETIPSHKLCNDWVQGPN